MRFFIAAVILMGLKTLALGADGDEAFLHLAGTAQYRSPKDTVDIIPTISTGTGGDTPLAATIFRPKYPPVGLLPAVIFIHGGGWRSGKHYNMFGACLAEKGYVVASIDYRLTDKATWPAQIEDCKLAVRWLRANAAKYNIDPNRIGVWGTSAGGHLASCVALMDEPALEGKGGYEGVSSKVQAVAVFCGPSDFTGDWLPDLPYPSWVVALFGAPREEKPDLWKSASPALAVKPGAPPFFIVHGDNDTHVPYSQGVKLKEALEKAGDSVEWISVKTGTHDFFVNPTSPQSTLDPTREKIMARLLAFFDQHLKAGS
ncbi:alpha/beta hydrolase [soil metagenome]